jgi:hypothetical protein
VANSVADHEHSRRACKQGRVHQVPDQKGHPLLSGGTIIPKDKIVTAEEAVRLIRDGATVATGGFVGIGFAEAIAIEIEKHFLEQGRPRDLTLMYAAGQGDGKESGLNHLVLQPVSIGLSAPFPVTAASALLMASSPA